jgi:hypothetical protein
MNAAKDDFSRVSSFELSFKFKSQSSHPVLGPLKLLQRPGTSECVIMREKVFQSSEQFGNEIKRQKARIQTKNKFFINFYDFSTVTKKDRITRSYKLRSFIEHFSGTLLTRGGQLEAQGQIPTADEMIRLFAFVINAGNFLHSQRRTHGEFSPSNVLILPNGEYRLLERLTNIEAPFPKNHLIRQKRLPTGVPGSEEPSSFICPLVFGAIRTCKDVPFNFDKQKSEVFSAGLCILQFGVSKSIQGIYNSHSVEINYRELESVVRDFRRNFAQHEVLSVLLENMLEPKVYQRKYFSELVSSIPHLERILEDLHRSRHYMTPEISPQLIESFIEMPVTGNRVSMLKKSLYMHEEVTRPSENNQRLVSSASKNEVVKNTNQIKSEILIDRDHLHFSSYHYTNTCQAPSRSGVLDTHNKSDRSIPAKITEEAKNLLKQPISFNPLSFSLAPSNKKVTVLEPISEQPCLVSQLQLKTSNILLIDHKSLESEQVGTTNVEVPLHNINYTNVYQASFKKNSSTSSALNPTTLDQKEDETRGQQVQVNRTVVSQTHSLNSSAKSLAKNGMVRSQQQSIDPLHKLNPNPKSNPYIFNVYTNTNQPASDLLVVQRKQSDSFFDEIKEEPETTPSPMTNNRTNGQEPSERTSKNSALNSTNDASGHMIPSIRILKESLSPQIMIQDRNRQFIRNEFLSPAPNHSESSRYTNLHANPVTIISRQTNPLASPFQTNNHNLKQSSIQAAIGMQKNYSGPLEPKRNRTREQNPNLGSPIPHMANVHSTPEINLKNFAELNTDHAQTERKSSSNIQSNPTSMNSMTDIDKELYLYQFSARNMNQDIYSSKVEHNANKQMTTPTPSMPAIHENLASKAPQPKLVISKPNSPCGNRKVIEFPKPMKNSQQIHVSSIQPQTHISQQPGPSVYHLPPTFDRENRLVFIKRNSCDNPFNSSLKFLNKSTKDKSNHGLHSQLHHLPPQKPLHSSQFNSTHRYLPQKPDGPIPPTNVFIDLNKSRHEGQTFERFLSPQVTQVGSGLKMPAPPSGLGRCYHTVYVGGGQTNQIVESDDKYFDS